MKINAYLLIIVIMIWVSLSAFVTSNDEPDDERRLLASCQTLTTSTEQVDSKPCIYFLKGFLAGASATETVIASYLSEGSIEPSSFTQRAYRTRVGKEAGQTSLTPLTHVCLPDEESETRIIRLLSMQRSPPIDSTKMLRDRIYNALKVEYPCDINLTKSERME